MKPLILLGITGLALCAQAAEGPLKARELFYTPVAPAAKPQEVKPEIVKPAAAKPEVPKPQAKAAPAKPQAPAKAGEAAKAPAQPAQMDASHLLAAQVPLGLRYAVLKRDAAGKFTEVDPDQPFRAGDRIRLTVSANTPGYLYVVMQGSSGNWQLLFPSGEISGGNNQVRSGQNLQIPPGDRGQFVFDEQAGTEKLFIVLTREPEQDLDKLIYSMGKRAEPDKGSVMIAQASVSNDLIDRLRGSVRARDLVFEKVDTSSAAPEKSPVRVENAAYVVNPSTAPDARLVVDVALRHR